MDNLRDEILLDGVSRLHGPAPVWVLGPLSERTTRAFRLAGFRVDQLSEPDLATASPRAILIVADIVDRLAADPAGLPGRLARLCGGILVCRVRSAGQLGHDQVAVALLNGAFRRHRLEQMVRSFEKLNHPASGDALIFERIEDEVAARYPLAWLRAERDLHMDMTREAGRRADAHLARYEWARSFVRPGDRVLDAACGLGYGAAAIAAGTSAAAVTGLDISEKCVAYGKASFGAGLPHLSFRCGDVIDLSWAEDASLDLVISFETIEHISDPDAFLTECVRVLTPGGRIVLSVPNDWTDETGRDPNPYHRWVFDWPAILALVSQHLVLEVTAVQTAGGGMKLSDAPRLLEEVPRTALDRTATEWCLVAAMRSPFSDQPYLDIPVARNAGGSRNAIVFDEMRWPWLQHALVSPGWRARSYELRAALIAQVRASNQSGVIDLCAADVVAAYDMLRSEHIEVTAAWCHTDRILRHVDRLPGTALGLRWRISALQAASWLLLAQGEPARAGAVLARIDPSAIDGTSVTSLVGVASSRMTLAALQLAAGSVAGARRYWREVIALHHRVTPDRVEEGLLDSQRPLPQAAREIGVFFDFVAQAAALLSSSSDEGRVTPAVLNAAAQASRQGELDALQRHARDTTSINLSFRDAASERASAFQALLDDRRSAQHIMEHQQRVIEQKDAAFAALLDDRRSAQHIMEHQQRVIEQKNAALAALVEDCRLAQEIMEAQQRQLDANNCALAAGTAGTEA